MLPSFIRLSHIPLYGRATFRLSMHLSEDTWDVSTVWLLCLILYKYLFKSLSVSCRPFKKVYNVVSGTVLGTLTVLSAFNLYPSPYEGGVTIILVIFSLSVCLSLSFFFP